MPATPVDTGPRKVTFTTEVARPADELFALLANPHRHREVDGSGTVQDTVTGPDHLRQGDRFSVNMKMYGVPYRITSRVTELVDNEVVEWRHPLGHRWRWQFEPVAGGTRVTETFDYSTVPGVQAALLNAFGIPRTNARGIKATLDKLSS